MTQFLSEKLYCGICEKLAQKTGIPLEEVKKRGRVLLEIEGVYIVSEEQLGQLEQEEFEMEETLRKKRLKGANIIGGLTDILQTLEGKGTEH